MSDHLHDHDHTHDAQDHDHAHDLQVTKEPLDPANQSLADALRLSFRVLKFVMIILVAIFLLSGVFMVDQKEVVVVMRFGRLVGDPREPGLNFAWPYPIDELRRVDVSPRSMQVKTFWLNISEKYARSALSDIPPRGSGLQPGVDGALVTGDRKLMHLLMDVDYQITNRVRLRADRIDPAEQVSDAVLFVLNVDDAEKLLQAVLQQAAVAEAGRTTSDVVLNNPQQLASAVRARAQKVLDRLETGIELVKVAAKQSYYPLQARDQYLSVTTAENYKQQAINQAESDRTKKLLGVAGEAWRPLQEEFERLDQVADENRRAEIIARIDQILMTEAKGEAGGKIQVALKDREKILDDTIIEVTRFNALIDEYQRSPELVRSRLQARMLNDLFANPNVVKWWMPAGDKQLVLLLNKDPEEIRKAERELLKKKAEQR